MSVKTIWPSLVFIAVWCLRDAVQSASNNHPSAPVYRQPLPRRVCDTERLESSITKLEKQIAVHFENVGDEQKETNQKLESVEFRLEETQQAVADMKHDLGKLLLRSNTNENTFDNTSSNLVRGMELTVITLRALFTDVTQLKKDLSQVLKDTSELLQKNDRLLSKYSTDVSNEAENYDKSHQIPPDLFTKPSQLEAPKTVPKNCYDILQYNANSSGVHLVQPETSERPFMVFCDLETNGGGWTVLQNRWDGSQEFYLNWSEYKIGFGNLGGEFWLGLDRIHILTATEVNELLVELEDFNGERAYAFYEYFSVGSELEGYPLKVLGGYTGTAGDSLSYHAGSRFSTRDVDQDSWNEGSCSQSHGGGWWYKGCDTSNLNGRYLKGDLGDSLVYQGMYWGGFKGPQYSLAKARIMIRPRRQNSLQIL